MLHDKKKPSLKDKHMASADPSSNEVQARRRGRPVGSTKVKVTIKPVPDSVESTT